MGYPVVIKQAGGKYGEFTCPQCGGIGFYKFTGATGACEKCGAQYMLTDGGVITDLGFTDYHNKEHNDVLAVLEGEVTDEGILRMVMKENKGMAAQMTAEMEKLREAAAMSVGGMMVGEQAYHCVKAAIKAIQSKNEMQALGILRTTLFMLAEVTGHDKPDLFKPFVEV